MSLPGPTRPGSVHPWCDGGAEGGASLRVTLRLMLEVLNVNRRRRPQLEGYVGQEYGGQQYVGIDLHRRRTVVVRTTDAGEVLEAVQIVNHSQTLAEVIARAGESPEVVLEATYGWY